MKRRLRGHLRRINLCVRVPLASAPIEPLSEARRIVLMGLTLAQERCVRPIIGETFIYNLRFVARRPIPAMTHPRKNGMAKLVSDHLAVFRDIPASRLSHFDQRPLWTIDEHAAIARDVAECRWINGNDLT